MDKNLVFLVVIVGILLLSCAVFADDSKYVMPTRNLVIVDVSEGKEIEKKIAEQADLFFSREMKPAALLGPGGITGYKATFTLNLQNVSGQDLRNVSLIETVPKQVAGDANEIKSDANFLILEKDPVIKFDLGTIPTDGLKRISYTIYFDYGRLDTVTSSFKDMNIPTGLIPISPNDCTGIMCNDFNPCTVDYCSEGKCVYDIALDGLPCGNDLICSQGTCSKSKNLETWLKVSAILVTVALVWLVLVFISKMRKKKAIGK